MTADDLIAGVMAAVSAATLAAFCVLAAPAVLAALINLKRKT